VGLFFFIQRKMAGRFCRLFLGCFNGTRFSSVRQTQIMRAWELICCFALAACGSGPNEVAVTTTKTADTAHNTLTQVSATNTENSFAKDTESLAAPPVQMTPRPSGVYRFLMPYEQGKKILHTIAFYPTTYRLQEEYPGRKDSVVITEGTWAASEGFIWLYKDQILRGRYTWKGDTLQYYSPRLKQRFSMTQLSPAAANETWQTKKKEGMLVYGVGNEPFWSVEVSDKDSMVLSMPDWKAPLSVKRLLATSWS